MARVISDTGIPDKSVGNRVADRSWTRDTVRTRQIHRICARQSAYRADFFLSLSLPRAQYRPPVIIASRRLTRRVEIVSFSRTRWSRTVRIINGIGSPDFGTITVTVTIMGGGEGDNDGGNSDSSIFVELATQYRSDTAPLRADGREEVDAIGNDSIVGNLCRLIKSNFQSFERH